VPTHNGTYARLNWPNILPERGIHFGTVTPPKVGQRPTFGLESSLLWETSMLTVAQSTRDSHHCTEVDTPFAGYAWSKLTLDLVFADGFASQSR